MNPADLVTSKLIDICSNKRTIVVCGYTKTGKVTIAKKIAETLNRPLFISDNYISEDDRLNSLYVFMDHIMPYYEKKIPIIVEGILCFRLLRKGIQLQNFFPDLIIKTKCNDDTIQHFYKKDNEANKIPRALSFNKGLNTIWNDYLTLLSQKPEIKRPKYVELETSLHQFK